MPVKIVAALAVVVAIITLCLVLGTMDAVRRAKKWREIDRDKQP